MDKIPAGMTKDRYIEMRVQDAIIERNDFDILVMGHPEGPGCYCYINSLLRSIIDRVTKSYDLVVMDNAAGMEHISRRTAGGIDRLVLVSDYSIQGLRSAKKIYDLAKSLGIRIGSAWLVINKVTGGIAAIKDETENVALALAGTIFYEDAVAEWSVSGKSIFNLVSKNVKDSVSVIIDNLIKG
jgi:CO dehydrogenase maturation factor